MTNIDIDAQPYDTDTHGEPAAGAFAVWYDRGLPFATFMRADDYTGKTDDPARWINADPYAGRVVYEWVELCAELAAMDGPHLLAPAGEIARLTAVIDAAVALVVAIGRAPSENPKHTQAEETALIAAVAAAGLLPVVEAREVDANVVAALREAGEDQATGVLNPSEVTR